MVICPIARAVHCTGCMLVKFCPAKTILGDFGKVPEGADPDVGSQPTIPDQTSNYQESDEG